MGGAPSLHVSHVHVVIVGGGFGGAAAAQQLKSKGVPFTLIDTRDAFHHNPGALRACVAAGFAKRTFISFCDTFGDAFVQGRVQNIDVDAQTVFLQDGKEIQYTHLILSTGTDGPFPGKVHSIASHEDAIRQYEDLMAQIQEADSVLVVGGGSTGVEMAAEIKTEYPTKKVVLVHARDDLADPELQLSVRQRAKQVLLEKGVELLLGQRVCRLSELQTNVTVKNQRISTDQGTALSTDLIITCTGMSINSSAYSAPLGQYLQTLRSKLTPDDVTLMSASCMASNGALKVNEHLQVHGFTNIFAVGDCADVNEPKMAYHAGLHASVAVSNIINGECGKALSSYQTGAVTMLLAMGRDDGVGQFYGVALPRTVVCWTKSRDLLLWKSWRDLGQKE